jgi:aldehyde dehydrogenase (NAD+)
MESMRSFFATEATKDIRFRINQLKKLAHAIRDNQSAIESALYTDLGKSKEEAYLTEIQILLDEIRFQIRHLKRWSKPTRVKSGLALLPSSCHIIPEPYGVVLIIAPWNYPFQLLIAPLIGTIAAGNCAVLKPSPQAPATAALSATLLSTLFEPEYVQVFTGEGQELEHLLEQRFDYLFFTGSPSTGRFIMQKAAVNLCPVTLELGGKSPCVVLASADIALAAKRIAFGKFINAGQTCVAPDYILVQRELKPALIEALKLTIQDFYGTDPLNSPHYGRIVNLRFLDRLTGLLETSGGKVVYGGTANHDCRYLEPTLIDEPLLDSALMQEEIFGPILPLIAIDSAEEAIAFINARNKPLALYVFGSTKEGKTILFSTSSGGSCLNDTILHVANKHLPFGGVGESGMGRYHGKYSFDTFSHQRAVVSSRLWFDLTGKYPPYKQFNLIKRLLR